MTVTPCPQDYISLFPVEDMQPSKLMRLLSSNEDDASILSSPSEHLGIMGLPRTHSSLTSFLDSQLMAVWQSRSLHFSVPSGCSDPTGPPPLSLVGGWRGI